MMNLIEMSFTASILIIVIMIIRTLFLNKLPKIIFPILFGSYGTECFCQRISLTRQQQLDLIVHK